MLFFFPRSSCVSEPCGVYITSGAQNVFFFFELEKKQGYVVTVEWNFATFTAMIWMRMDTLHLTFI